MTDKAGEPPAPSDDPLLNLPLAIAELASIQVDLLRLLERQSQLLGSADCNVPDMMGAEDQQYRREVTQLRTRAQVVLEWIARHSGLL